MELYVDGMKQSLELLDTVMEGLAHIQQLLQEGKLEQTLPLFEDIVTALAALVVEDGLAETEEEAIEWLNRATPDVKAYLYDLPAERLANVMSGAAIRMSVFPHLFADGTVLPKEAFDVLKTGEFNDVPIRMIATESELNLFAQRDPYFSSSLEDGSVFTDEKKRAAWEFATKYGNILYGAANGQWNAQSLLQQAKSPIYTAAFAWGTNPDVVGEQMATIDGALHGINIDMLFGIPKNALRNKYPEAYASAGVEDLAKKLRDDVGHFLWTGDPNGDGLVEWKRWTSIDEGPTHLWMDADEARAIFQMIDMEDVFAEIENDTTVDENVKKDLITKVLNGRFFSKEFDLHFNNDPPLLK